jgi:hypothetical protein
LGAATHKKPRLCGFTEQEWAIKGEAYSAYSAAYSRRHGRLLELGRLATAAV